MHTHLRKAALYAAATLLAVTIVVGPGTSPAAALGTGTVSTHINWDRSGITGGGTFWGSTAYNSQRHFDSWVNDSCGGSFYWNVTDVGMYYYNTAISGTGDHAVIDMSSRNGWNGGIPYNTCDGFYHDYRISGDITATGLHRVVESTPAYIVTERDAIATAVFCMEAWFGSGAACTGLTGSGTLRWRIPLT